MKKLFLFLAATLGAASLTLNVQAGVRTFDFEGNNPTIPAEWINDANYPWVVVNDAPEGFGGTYCIKSGNSGVSSSASTLIASFTFATEGTISFDAGYWGEGTSTIHDKCEFFIDNTLKLSAGGVQTWKEQSFTVPAGTHLFRWVYTKDANVDLPEDAFFLDNIVVDLGTLPPTVENGYVHYDNGTYESSLGTKDGTLFSWGIKIPAGTVSDTYLTKVSVYAEISCDLILSIYQGETTPADATKLHEQEVALRGGGAFQEILLAPSVQIDPTQDIWIVFTKTSRVIYPAAYCSIENADNGRWFAQSDGVWTDIGDISERYVNIAWMIRAFFASAPKDLPYVNNIQASGITLNSANLTWEGFGTFDLRYKSHSSVLDNNFDESVGEWTTIDADGDGHDWTLNPVEIDGTFIGSASFDNPSDQALNPDNYFVSPLFIIGDSITFQARGQDANDFDEHFGVAISTTSNTDPKAFTTIWDETIGASRTWKKYKVDLSDYKGQPGYVAIRHYNSYNRFWLLVDDIRLYPTQEVKPESDWKFVRNLNEAAYALSELEPYQKYWVQVRASYDDVALDWSDAYQFITVPTETAIEDINAAATHGGSSKILHNGCLYILRNNHIFTPQGQRVK